MSKHSAFNNLYTRFQYNKSKSPVDILKGTKNLIVHSSSYNSYSRDYTNLTQTSTFKSPDIKEYPILKNQTFIPLRCQTATTRSHTKPPIKKLLLQINTNPSTKNNNNLQTENELCFITEPPSKRRCQTARNDNRQYRLNNIVNSFRYKEDIYLLMNMLFYENSYEKLVYDESEIFHKEDHYVHYIESVVDHFKKNKNENQCNHLEKMYFSLMEDNTESKNTIYTYTQNNNKVLTTSKLSLHSMTIDFINLTDKKKQPISFSIPFALLPVFYYKNFQNIKYILLALIQFSNTFDSITLNENEFYNLLQNSIEFNNKPILQETKVIKFLKMNTRIPNHTHTPLLSKKLKVTQTHNKTKLFNQHQHKQWKYLNTLTNYWLAGEYLYKIEFRVPEITVKVKNKTITKFIDVELLMFLLEHNFINWDFYVIHYLFSIKSFRKIIESILSKQIPQQISYTKISLSTIKTNCLSLKDNTYHFYYTFNIMKNYLCVLHSYSIIVIDKRVIPKREHIFKLALDRMKIILDISKQESLSQFFQKILSINKTNLNIDLNINILDDFDPSNYYLYKITEHNIRREDYSSHTNQGDSSTFLMTSSKLLQTSTHLKKNDFTSSTNVNNSPEEYSIQIHQPYIELIEYISIQEANDNVHNHRGSNVNCIYSDTTEYIHRIMKQEVLEKVCEENKLENIIKLLVKCNLSSGGCTIAYDVASRKRKTTRKKASVLGNMIQLPKRTSVESSKIFRMQKTLSTSRRSGLLNNVQFLK